MAERVPRFFTIELRWRHRIGHECGHTIAALAHDNCPKAIRIGQMVCDADRSIHHGLTVGCALPDTAPAEDRATVILAGMVAETLFFGSHGNGAKRDVEMVEKLVEEIRARDGETRSAVQIRNDLITATMNLLNTHRYSLDLLYNEAVKRVEKDQGFAAFETKGYAVELLTGEMIKRVWDYSKGKNQVIAALPITSAPACHLDP
jgi:hypothetical protein